MESTSYWCDKYPSIISYATAVMGDGPDWIWDSGCTHHMTKLGYLLTNITGVTPRLINVAGGKPLMGKVTGTLGPTNHFSTLVVKDLGPNLTRVVCVV
jgi:hypothetical protein